MINFVRSIRKFPDRGIIIWVLIFSLVIRAALLISNYRNTVKLAKYLANFTPIFSFTVVDLQDLNYRLGSSFSSFKNCLLRSLVLYSVLKKTFSLLHFPAGFYTFKVIKISKP